MSGTCLIGYTGFVGTNLMQQREFDDLFRSTNIQEIRGRSYELLICAGVSAAKWKANQAPELDRAAIDQLLEHLVNVKVDRFVLISTVDVYPVGQDVDEAFDCSSRPNHAYGTNRLYLEEALRLHFPNLNVVRLPGLFGPGLKKNVIFDLLQDNCLAAINAQSVFQYYDMTKIWHDIDLILQSGVPLVNLATEPIETHLIHQRFFPQSVIGAQAAPKAAYDIRTRHAALFGKCGHYRFDSEEVLNQLAAFIEQTKQRKIV